MALRYALLLIGIIVVAIVVMHTIDAARRRRIDREDEKQETEPPPPPPRPEPVAGLEFHPSSETVSEKKALAPDSKIVEPTPVRTRDAFEEELETLTEVATMPLNLDPGIRTRSRRPDLGRPAAPDDKIDFIM